MSYGYNQPSYTFGTNQAYPPYPPGQVNTTYPHINVTKPHVNTTYPHVNATYPHVGQTYNPGHQQYTVVNQPHGQIHNYGIPQNVRQWSSGVCGCCEDMQSCCLSFWCLPFYQCYLSHKMGECCCGPFICGGGGTKLGGMICPSNPNTFLIAMRTKMRAQNGIQGSICDDVCDTTCCECCVTAQIAREMKHQGLLY